VYRLPLTVQSRNPRGGRQERHPGKKEKGKKRAYNLSPFKLGYPKDRSFDFPKGGKRKKEKGGRKKRDKNV